MVGATLLSEDEKSKVKPSKKKAWRKSKLSAAPIVNDTAGSKRRWRYERRFRNFEVRSRFAS